MGMKRRIGERWEEREAFAGGEILGDGGSGTGKGKMGKAISEPDLDQTCIQVCGYSHFCIDVEASKCPAVQTKQDPESQLK